MHTANIVMAAIVMVTFLGSAFISATIAETRGHTLFKHFLAGLFLPVAYPILINKKMTNIAKEHKSHKKELESSVRSEINAKMAKVQYELECKKLVKKDLPIPDFIDWFNQRKNVKNSEVKVVESEDEITEKPDIPQRASINREFIENLAVDNSGNRQGPFQLVLSDGRELTILHIKSIMDEIATFEIVDHNGVAKNIRLKYANIVSLGLLHK